MWPVTFFLFYTVAFAEERESRIVQITQGPVRGYKNQEYGIFEFQSIPYATAPTGPNRFKAPLPPPKWVEPFDAENKGIACPQTDPIGLISKNLVMQEDCLIANIYVPEQQGTSIPVVVYIHGGGFIVGHGNLMTPRKFVASKNVIVVTFNYRVGAHGFLCLGTEDIPGNAGMKDQVALLRWVKENISNFGGDPNDITIAGYSAGSASVDLLMISKMAKGLFNKVIPESGANTATFAVQPDPIESAKKYAKLINFDNVDDFNALQEFYKTVPLEKLNSANVMFREDSVFLVSPCIESKTNEESFLDDSPVNILKSGNYEKLPMLYGFANMEGLVRAPLFDVWKDQMNEKFCNFLPADLKFESDQEKEDVASKVKQFYFSDNPVGPETVLGYVDYFSDVMFTYSILRSIKLQVDAGNNNIYLYEYSYVDGKTPLVPYTKIRGANHCAQSNAVLDGINAPGYQIDPSEEYLKMTDVMRDIWHSFITTGNPIPKNSGLPEWPPTGPNGSPYMSLNKTIELKENLLQKRIMFWDEIYTKHYRVPVPPSPPPLKHTEL